MNSDKGSMICEATTEKEMREAAVPSPKSPDDLLSYINSLVARGHNYGTCVYAISMAATAAFHYVASKVGASGFQASCADMDILRRTRLMDGPFIILKAEDALYPQYDLPAKLREFLNREDVQKWLREQAAGKLATTPDAHPEVLAHWERLAAANGKE